MLRFSFFNFLLVSTIAFAQQPSGTSASPAPGTHMDQSTVQTVGTTPNGVGAVRGAARRLRALRVVSSVSKTISNASVTAIPTSAACAPPSGAQDA